MSSGIVLGMVCGMGYHSHMHGSHQKDHYAE